jgi:hypothetical protein
VIHIHIILKYDFGSFYLKLMSWVGQKEVKERKIGTMKDKDVFHN